MCIICTEYLKGKMTIVEASDAVEEYLIAGTDKTPQELEHLEKLRQSLFEDWLQDWRLNMPQTD